MASVTKGIFIVAAKRTPIGVFGGRLADKNTIDLLEHACRAALAAGNVDPKMVDSIIAGNVIGSSHRDNSFITRHVGLRIGVPQEFNALIVNRLCGSGFQSVINAAQEMIMGDSKVVIAGGSENMSLSPFVARGIRFGTKLGGDYRLEDALHASLTDAHCNCPMGITAENLAVQYKITRDEADDYALGSQTKWNAANAAGYFKEELAPIEVTFKGKKEMMAVDEHPKPKTTKESLSKLKPSFKKDGIVTAGNASGINDGAGAIVLATEAALKEYNLKPLARVAAYGVAGVDPKIMGIGPVPAINKMLAKVGIKLSDVDLVEINEAFAPQALSCFKDLKIDPSKFNVNGGAIAIGHPLAASGSRIVAHLTHEMRRRNVKNSIASACIGGGQGIALLLERC